MNIQKPLQNALRAMVSSEMTICRHTQRKWASISFSGSIHRISITLRGADAIEDAIALENTLPEHEFSIPGYLVADAGIVESDTHSLDDDVVAAHLIAEILLLTED